MDQEGHNVTTITILDVSLSLVHIPRSRLDELNRPIIKQLLLAQPKFLNLTANQIELSIFAEEDDLVDFEPIARRDRQRRRLRVSASGAPSHRRRHRSHSCDPADAVEISLEKWRVLQIDSHDDSLSNSGSRVRELSAPLAAAGISILYQSSYLSDFIFVKASRLPEVIKILGDEGFTLYNTDPYELYSHLQEGIGHVGSEKRFVHLHDEVSRPGSPGTTSPAVFSRTRSPSMASLAALSNAVSKPGTVEELTSSALLMHRTKVSGSPMSSCATSRASRTPKKSLSPTAAPVEVLAPDLACVGLNEGAVDVWGAKIIKLVGYPELIPTPNAEPIPSLSFVSYDERRNSLANSLYGSTANVPCRNFSSSVAGPLSPSAVFGHDLEDSDAEKESANTRSASLASSSSSSSCSSSEGDEYFSSSSPCNRTRTSADSTPSLVSATSQSSVRSLPENLHELRRSARPRLSKVSTALPLQFGASPAEETRQTRSHTESQNKSIRTRPLRVPFFSFTRTAEGSSLTTDICALSSLFGLDERHMVICSGTLLEAGDELNALARAEQEFTTTEPHRVFDVDSEELLEREEPAPGTMKCLQIDLQRFGLDKHGLVNRFSRVLEENSINHMYSSTYKTANLLVDKANAGRAQALLRSC